MHNDHTQSYLTASLAWRSGLSAPSVSGSASPRAGRARGAEPIVSTRALPAGRRAAVGLGLVAGWSWTGRRAWGRSLARLAGLPDARRVAWASGLTFGPLTVAAMFVLGRTETVFVEERLAGAVPIHVIFAIAFTLAAFAVTGGLALAAGWAAHGPRFGLQPALWAGLAAALAFLWRISCRICSAAAWVRQARNGRLPC